VKEKSLTRDEFKTVYRALKQDVDNNFVKANTIAGPVYNLELSWQRYEKTMSGNSRK
jgi:hypothetical protein